jgi:hypothetical protein
MQVDIDSAQLTSAVEWANAGQCGWLGVCVGARVCMCARVCARLCARARAQACVHVSGLKHRGVTTAVPTWHLATSKRVSGRRYSVHALCE